MVLAREDEAVHPHPYWYARIVGVFHVNARHGQRVQRMDILWVRWFGRDIDEPVGWAAKRLYKIGFLDSNEPGAFGFLDPDLVIRGIHLIPAFVYGQTNNLLPKSIARRPSDNETDWNWYYVNMYVICE